MTACPACGTPVKPGKRFCGGCGAALVPAVSPAPEAPAAQIAPPPPPKPPPPAAVQAPPEKPTAKKRGVEQELLTAWDLFGKSGLPHWLMPVFLVVAFFFWPAGLIVALACMVGKASPALKSMGKLSALSALCGGIFLSLAGTGVGVGLFVVVLLGFLGAALWKGLGAPEKAGRRLGFAMAGGMGVSLFLMALVGSGSFPVLAKAGHLHLDFLFSRWQARDLAALKDKEPDPAITPITLPENPQDSMDKKELCQTIIQQLTERENAYNAIKTQCDNQYKQKYVSPTCRNLGELKQAYDLTHKACTENSCGCVKRVNP